MQCVNKYLVLIKDLIAKMLTLFRIECKLSCLVRFKTNGDILSRDEIFLKIGTVKVTKIHIAFPKTI